MHSTSICPCIITMISNFTIFLIFHIFTFRYFFTKIFEFWYEFYSSFVTVAATDICFFWYLVWVFGRGNCAKFQIAFPCRNWLKNFLRYCNKLRQWNKQTVSEHYHLVLHNNHEIKQWLHKDFNDSEVLIIFKLPELTLSCSKLIVNIFQLSQLMIKLPMDSFYIFIWRVFKKILFIKSLVFW